MDRDKKNSRYERLFQQLEKLLQKEGNALSRMATITAVLHHKIEYFFWTGFYIYSGEKLSVGPYQGPVACQTLCPGKGVCWKAFIENKTIIVDNVHEFPGHIACNSRSNSEIVVPIHNRNNSIIGVLDVDSKEFSSFNSTDAFWLEKIVTLIYRSDESA